MSLVDPFERLDLGLVPPFVTGLVRRLDVHADDVVIFECLDGVAALGGVIGVEVAGRARNVDARPAGSSPTPRTRSTAEIIAPFKR